MSCNQSGYIISDWSNYSSVRRLDVASHMMSQYQSGYITSVKNSSYSVGYSTAFGCCKSMRVHYFKVEDILFSKDLNENGF